MKIFRQLCIAFTITLLLALPALADQMDVPPAPSDASTATLDGQMDTPPAPGQMDTTLTTTLVQVIQSVLG